ncbi:MAG: hypothetical protein E5Y10_22135 [Mesorhizobium sp.]|uniref:hypothetical protein n=1 Tax=Mesorhizobium sp. TaxID=1871066 RepID=UPI0011F4B588|nr:hypothetical protein [Mesorhizobium sp.]TIN36830.1 MAG: hypothetical protein E5Y13_22745 [Mesorhizobium sp.]TJU73566.1 MAG: hypothetical protein E5Y15_32645 [Mesorhizobium sp.]TJU86675.1 MAG: hypothetical protein E5Y10_22135 [Mesorhizobium sp.]
MRFFDYFSFAIGVLVGLAGFSLIAIESDYRGISAAQFCATGETLLVCTRQWSEVVAIVAGFATVLFILVQMRASESQHRESISLQTFEMRALFARTVYLAIEPIEQSAEELLKAGRLWSANEADKINSKTVYQALEQLHKIVSGSLLNVEQYDDGTLLERRSDTMRDLEIAKSAWQMTNGYNEQVPTETVNEDGIIAAEAAAETALDYAEAFRTVHDVITRGDAPTIRQRIRRALAVTAR